MVKGERIFGIDHLGAVVIGQAVELVVLGLFFRFASAEGLSPLARIS